MAIDRSSLTDPRAALNLVFKKQSTADVYQKNNIFHVRALTKSFQMGPEEETSFLNRIFGGSPMKKFFIGRIIGANSPHSFLPDPCDADMKGDSDSDTAKNARRLVSLHTTFLMGGDIEKEQVEIGDFFEVVLKGGSNNSPFNLQFGTALRKLSDGEATTDTTECDSLEDIFAGSTSGGYGGIAMGKGGTELFIDDVGNCEDPDPEELIIMHPLKNADLGITSPFGPRKAIRDPDRVNVGPHIHRGVDFAGGAGGIFAVYDGTVALAEFQSGAGNWVWIRHEFKGEAFHSIYMHMKRKPMVSAGQAVSQGQQIGLIGTTGMSTGPHLHFEIRGPASHIPQNGTWKDKRGKHSADWKPNHNVAELIGLSKTCKELEEDPESAFVNPNKPMTEKEIEEWERTHEGASGASESAAVSEEEESWFTRTFG